MTKTIVISLGGSLIVPDSISIEFLKGFERLIEKSAKKRRKFAIICGGGKTARKYQEAASAISSISAEGLDWLGIMATRLNAHLVKTAFGSYAEEMIIHDPTKKLAFKKNIVIAAGWKPGWSTDYDAVLLAKQLKAKQVINMSNIDYVYDKDPRKFSDARPIESISWGDFRKIIGSKWTAGLNAPFDPIAAKEAEKLGLKAAVIGKNLKNLESCIEGKEFKGTIIS